MSDFAIKVNNLSKSYKLYDDPIDRLKESFHPFRKKYHHNFHALRGIDFEVEKGKTIGIIGANGAGKSTLLKILTGVLTPSGGTYSVKGRISSLLELGSGFNPELTGLENVYFNGTILGYSKNEIDAKIDDIIAFADIGEFIHQSVKTYSSGMQVRLAFAVAINTNPDVLIIDEALSVGDIKFQLKCFRRLQEFQDAGKTIVLVTHDTGAIINYCSKAIWLHNGKMKEIGNPEEICKKYAAFMIYDAKGMDGGCSKKLKNKVGNHGNGTLEDVLFEDVSKCPSFGEGGAVITGVALYDPKTFEPLKILTGGENLVFAARVKALADISEFIFGFMINDSYGNHLTGMNTHLMKEKIKMHNGEETIYRFSFTLPKFKNGRYTVTTSVAEGSQLNHLQHHWIHDAYDFQIASNEGISKLDILLNLEDIKFSKNDK
ncbi:ABC transporter ATP-binding protein [Candidatus Peregrinibacteria bacterium]|jgi:ABC-type polysaccharide/polyol phosphate transport system ATPase subunit|nr:ABC transporter ATP-binding protein [Candidatus Peregrinibacteria bacterium]